MTPPLNKIICSDCLSAMKDWPDGCVDLVFGSPPYEDARTYRIGYRIKGQDWVDWMVAVVKESLRVCNGLVAFVVEGRTRKFRWSATPVLLMADLHRAGIHLRKPPAFQRHGIPGSGGPDWLRNDYEFIVCCTNGGKLPWSDNKAMGSPPKYAPGGEMSHRLSDGSRVNQWGYGAGNKRGPRNQDGSRGSYVGKPSHKIVTKRRLERGNEKGSARVQPAIANPGNVIKCNVGGGVMGSKLAHKNEAPFPESLVEFFVRSFCKPGGLVLDPFSGSGTTIATACKWGRKWIGIDIRASECENSSKRVAEKADQMALFEGQ